MKLGNASLNRRTTVPGDHASDYQAAHQGPLNILEEGRPTASWSWVSPAVLGDIDTYVQALVRR
jgi:hypothetical protein